MFVAAVAKPNCNLESVKLKKKELCTITEQAIAQRNLLNRLTVTMKTNSQTVTK